MGSCSARGKSFGALINPGGREKMQQTLSYLSLSSYLPLNPKYSILRILLLKQSSSCHQIHLLQPLAWGHGHVYHAVRYAHLPLKIISLSLSLSKGASSADFQRSGDVNRVSRQERSYEPSQKRPRLQDGVMLETLTDDIIRHIFSLIPDLKDRRSCAAVSQRWLRLQSSMKFSDFSQPPDCAFVSSEGQTAINDAQLALLSVIASSGRTLTELNIRADVTDSGLKVISHACSQLKKLTLRGCHKVGREGLSAIAAASPKLEHLSISSSPMIDDDGLIPFAMSCPHLALFTLDRCPLITDRALRAFSSFSHHLQTLSLSRCPLMTDSSLPAIFSLPKLSKLAISNSSLTDRSFSLLSYPAPKLQILKLEKCHGVTTQGLFLALEKLSPSLKSLSLIKCDGMGKSKIPLRAKCFHLRCLEINNCGNVDDETLFMLAAGVPLLRRITLSGLDRITDRGFLSLLCSLPRRHILSHVDLSNCRSITDRSVAALGGSAGSSLVSLSLEGCEKVTDWGLTFLSLLCSRLVDLDLTNCWRISDYGVAALTRKKELEMLSLEGCEGITDQTLTRLEEMADGGNLVSINLKKCQGLTREGVDSINHYLWWCDLIC